MRKLRSDPVTTKQPKDVFGEALRAYSQGDRSPFYLRDRSGKLFKIDLSRFFRPVARLSKLERKLISLAHGDILDVGCGTGNYFPLLARHGQVLGIDISPKAIAVGRSRGSATCRVADIFTFRMKRFDTITFLGNGLGIGGTVSGTRRLLANLLNDDGQILAIARRVTPGPFGATKVCPVWRQKVGREFGWISVGKDLLCDLCAQSGLRLSVVQGNQHYYLYRMTKD